MGNERVEGYAEGFKVGWDKGVDKMMKEIREVIDGYPTIDYQDTYDVVACLPKDFVLDVLEEVEKDALVENHEDSRGERATGYASESKSNKRDIGNPDVKLEKSEQEKKDGNN